MQKVIFKLTIVTKTDLKFLSMPTVFLRKKFTLSIRIVCSNSILLILSFLNSHFFSIPIRLKPLEQRIELMDGLLQKTSLPIFTSLLHLILLPLIVLCSGKKSDSSSVAPTQNTGETASPSGFWGSQKSRKKARKIVDRSMGSRRRKASTNEQQRSGRKKRGKAKSTQVSGSEETKDTIHI
ncbi:hypothetical protein CAEBREN_01957 [Caenorhabditis brenneri]|uniref:Uncharacterized protein n=1 Tax=Caenorhabditis brenneri TaxID=135651 RepID=G0MDJ0_CAEBE|nr:hypothetical protein CAEBREN_01957 [Caenorhabditis brenneri]